MDPLSYSWILFATLHAKHSGSDALAHVLILRCNLKIKPEKVLLEWKHIC